MGKKITAIVLTLLMLSALTACGSRKSAAAGANSQKEQVHTDAAEESEAVSEETSAMEEAAEGTGGKVLVAYFSLAGEQYEVGEIEKGNTQIIAEMIAEETDADLYSIDPVKEYPDDYDGKLKEATTERENDERPEISSQIENFDEYDTIFIGYPIWWGGMPMILYTFMESYDFSGKTVIPFNTHAGSGQAGTQQEIESVITNAEILDGFAIRGRTAQEDPEAAKDEINNWLENLGM